MVAEGDGLRGLQVGEAGHRVGGVFGGAGGEGAHARRPGVEAVDGVAHPQAEIGGDLVVAAARGVQAPAGLADAFGQARLDVHVDVFERLVEGEAARFDLGGDAGEAGFDGGLVGRPITPTCASMAAWAREPAISWRHSLRSKPIEALIRRMISAGAAAKRPPHWLLAGASSRAISGKDMGCEL